jgi:arginine decarboxylase
VSTIAQALQKYPSTKAILIVSPTYYGVCCDVAEIAQLAHQYNIPLIVDEAHGAHFKFHPDLPMSALAAGADMVIQSTHKTLSALTQASMLHCQGNRVQPDRLSRSLQLVQSTSPNYLLLASLDAARQQMAIMGLQLLSQTLMLVEKTRIALQMIPGIQVFSSAPVFDRTRLTITVSGLGITGFAADEILSEQYGVICELPSLRHLTFIFSIGTMIVDCDRLLDAITQLAQTSFPKHSLPVSTDFPLPETVISPREAFFAVTETVAIAQAIGRVSAELICPYPPGIPVLLPGERITEAAIEHLQQVLRSGGFVSGCADSGLQTVQVVA